MGAEFIDYMISDRITLPYEKSQFCSEKIIYLPNSYQPNDSILELREVEPDRSENGLPPTGFVFCCFNQSYKISAAEFEIWMRLLIRVEGSVLWLLKDNRWMQANLRKEAAARGVDPGRLVFADKLPHADHLARYRCADLFLDTFNYNAHTTASDSLRAGLPVVTKLGGSFAARVGASLLHAIGMPELVTETAEDYQRLALDVASNPDRLAALKAKLASNRLTTPLFDPALFARNIERAFEIAHERRLAGLAPDHIHID
jgi:predicted O-linked N-acetylglucosamine transferase (SPINDLY family)